MGEELGAAALAAPELVPEGTAACNWAESAASNPVLRSQDLHR